MTQSGRTVTSGETECLNIKSHLMVPIFWLMAVPMVDSAAEVIWPAWERVSWVFLYLSGKDSGETKRGKRKTATWRKRKK